MRWKDAESLSLALETRFKQIQQTLSGLPMINAELHVQAVGFRRYQEAWIGVLISPWFMNLMRFIEQENLAPGKKITQHFPSGQFEFVVADDIELGAYQSCSLFSPMFEFPQQGLAVVAANAVLQALFAEAEVANMSRRDLLRGTFSKRNARL